LLHEYAAAASVLFAATTSLQLKSDADYRVEIPKAVKASKAARAKCVEARLALESHKTLCETCKSVAASRQA